MTKSQKWKRRTHLGSNSKSGSPAVTFLEVKCRQSPNLCSLIKYILTLSLHMHLRPSCTPPTLTIDVEKTCSHCTESMKRGEILRILTLSEASLASFSLNRSLLPSNRIDGSIDFLVASRPPSDFHLALKKQDKSLHHS